MRSYGTAAGQHLVGTPETILATMARLAGTTDNKEYRTTLIERCQLTIAPTVSAEEFLDAMVQQGFGRWITW